MTTELYAVVTGKVQGVGYRDHVVQAAKEYDLTGYVRNRPDGSVEVLAQGYPEELRAFVTDIQNGSVLARVDDMRTEFRTMRIAHDEFKVLYE